MAGVWVAQLERFGYTMVVAERTKEKAVDALKEEYNKAYAYRNGFATIEEMEQDEEYKEYFSTAMEEVYCRKLEYGKVDWC